MPPGMGDGLPRMPAHAWKGARHKSLYQPAHTTSQPTFIASQQPFPSARHHAFNKAAHCPPPSPQPLFTVQPLLPTSCHPAPTNQAAGRRHLATSTTPG
eukprot:87885-Chlamydomonas_euryale.AAC.5